MDEGKCGKHGDEKPADRLMFISRRFIPREAAEVLRYARDAVVQPQNISRPISAVLRRAAADARVMLLALERARHGQQRYR